jgi:hypothetical protein
VASLKEQHELPELSGTSPAVERTVRRGRRSRKAFRWVVIVGGVIMSAGICWCIYHGLTVSALLAAACLAGGLLRGFSYARRLEELGGG